MGLHDQKYETADGCSNDVSDKKLIAARLCVGVLAKQDRIALQNDKVLFAQNFHVQLNSKHHIIVRMQAQTAHWGLQLF